MATPINIRDQRAAWAMVRMRKAVQDGLHGRMEIFFENGHVTHLQVITREKPPVDIEKAAD